MPLAHALAVDALALEREDGPELTAMWSWAPALLAEDAVRALAEGWFHVLRALVRLAEQPGASGLTPGDVPLVSLSQEEIEGLEADYRDH